MFQTLLSGLVAGYAVAMPLGAFAILLVTLTAHTSVRVGAAGAFGVATADTFYAAAALLGGTALAHAIRPVMGPMRWTAAAVLIGLALHMLLKARKTTDTPDDERPALNSLSTPLRAYLGFLGMTLLNPWAIIYFAALALVQPHDGGLSTMAAFTLGVFIASLTWQLFLAFGGNMLGRVIASPRGRLVTTALSSLVIIVLAVAMVAVPPMDDHGGGNEKPQGISEDSQPRADGRR